MLDIPYRMRPPPGGTPAAQKAVKLAMRLMKWVCAFNVAVWLLEEFLVLVGLGHHEVFVNTNLGIYAIITAIAYFALGTLFRLHYGYWNWFESNSIAYRMWTHLFHPIVDMGVDTYENLIGTHLRRSAERRNAANAERQNIVEAEWERDRPARTASGVFVDSDGRVHDTRCVVGWTKLILPLLTEAERNRLLNDTDLYKDPVTGEIDKTFLDTPPAKPARTAAAQSDTDSRPETATAAGAR